MIAYILIGTGLILMAVAIINFIHMLFLPIIKLHGVVYEREDDYLKYETPQGRRYLKQNLRRLIWLYIVCLLVGAVCFFAGIYLGYAEKGDSFFLYRKLFGEAGMKTHWDNITDDGKYKADDGNEYTYYIIVTGEKYVFSGEECDDYADLAERLSSIRRENTVVLIDSFAVSSAYHAAEDLIKQKGIKYKTAEE